jgi:nuclear transport factor 2 (NTF2) superfamily protein
MNVTALKPAMISEAQAWEILHLNERLFAEQNVAKILDGFSEDTVVEFADIPTIKGMAALKGFLESRFARQEGYQLTKELRAVNGDQIVGTWIGSWTDATNGNKMLGRGMEILTMENGYCTKWEATFNMWIEGGEPQSSLLMS